MLWISWRNLRTHRSFLLPPPARHLYCKFREDFQFNPLPGNQKWQKSLRSGSRFLWTDWSVTWTWGKGAEVPRNFSPRWSWGLLGLESLGLYFGAFQTHESATGRSGPSIYCWSEMRLQNVPPITSVLFVKHSPVGYLYCSSQEAATLHLRFPSLPPGLASYHPQREIHRNEEDYYPAQGRFAKAVSLTGRFAVVKVRTRPTV